jgi:hypothetical protein
VKKSVRCPVIRQQSPALQGQPACPYKVTLGCISPETIAPIGVVGGKNRDDPSCISPRSHVPHQPFPVPFDLFDSRNGNKG